MKVEERFFSNLVSPVDIRDYKIAVLQEKFPETFELPQVSIKNQGLVGSCVAHACSTVVEFHNKRQENTDVVFSTEFIYGYRPLGYYVGEGMYIRDALKTLQKVGVCPKADLTGNNKCQKAMENVNKKIDVLKTKAYPHRISTYAKVKTVEEIKQALMTFGYVIVSMPGYKNYKLKKGVYTFPENPEKNGYHCVVIYGGNEHGGLIQNSGGKLWGNGGRFIVPFTFEGREAWAVTDNIIGESEIIVPEDKGFIKLFSKLINLFLNLFKKNK